LQVVPRLAYRVELESVACGTTRCVIDALAVGEGALHLKAVAHQFIDSDLKSVVPGSRHPHRVVHDRHRGGIQESSGLTDGAGAGKRPAPRDRPIVIASRRLRWKDGVDRICLKRIM